MRLEPTTELNLRQIDANADGGLTRTQGEARLEKLTQELGELQELFYAAGKTSLLVILQGIDTSGKDGAIRGVFAGVNPQGCQVTSFKTPTAAELDHDFLWRIHRHTPALGMIGVFNRSHYEDVVVVRVRKLAPASVWRRRYSQINAFERLLTENGTIVLKFYLHISNEEQEARLLAREQDVTKFWKLSAQDWIERRSWDDYIRAYEDALRRCSTEAAPWTIIPANRKWFRNLAIAERIVQSLRPLRQGWLDALEQKGDSERAAIVKARAKTIGELGTKRTKVR
ncbi:MAG: polyphosphate kinase 2 family protein [Chloroflexota bacterium]|nr:polyphosphate kinase 2 family protein [Chloroflexota bacterium]